jgi:site-specific DNA-methyltransferase (adenine-specific)
MIELIQTDCGEFLSLLQQTGRKFRLVFADPPDNLGLNYANYRDKMPADQYYNWLEMLILKSIAVGQIVWFSYYWEHDLELTYRIRNILRYRHPSWRYKKILWRYTFGQYTRSDCGSGFRYMVRLSGPGVAFDTDAILVESERQRLGDARACGDGRVPDDVWDFPRVTGNSHERRAWHPTQHPEGLVERILRLCGPYDRDNPWGVLDLFSGTGTVLRVAQRYGIPAIACELDAEYVVRTAADLNIRASEVAGIDNQELLLRPYGSA